MVMRSTQVVIETRIGMFGDRGRREEEVGGRGVFQFLMARRLAVGSARGRRMLVLVLMLMKRRLSSSGNDIVKRRNGRRIVEDGLRMAILLTLGLFTSQARLWVGRDGRH